MHRESAIESLLGTIALLQTGFFHATGVWDKIICFIALFIFLFLAFEQLQEWEEALKKKVRRAATQTDK